MRPLLLVLALLTGPLVGCDDDDDGFNIGAFCEDRLDCATDYCCESDNCGGGTCTLRCDGDLDCPEDMLCEHGVCFFTCNDDRDCGDGMSCEHDQTVCEWTGG